MAINEEAGFDEYTDTLLKAKTALYSNAYITANAGFGESTQDFVFSGRNLISLRRPAFRLIPTLKETPATQN